MNIKKIKGKNIYKVESETTKGKFYEVDLSEPGKPFCSCPAFAYQRYRKGVCKHIIAVKNFLAESDDPEDKGKGNNFFISF